MENGHGGKKHGSTLSSKFQRVAIDYKHRIRPRSIEGSPGIGKMRKKQKQNSSFESCALKISICYQEKIFIGDNFQERASPQTSTRHM